MSPFPWSRTSEILGINRVDRIFLGLVDVIVVFAEIVLGQLIVTLGAAIAYLLHDVGHDGIYFSRICGDGAYLLPLGSNLVPSCLQHRR